MIVALKVLAISICLFANLSSAQSNPTPRAIRIVTFGTSLTSGGGWQEPLRQRLQVYLPGIDIEMVNRGIPGAASDAGLHNVGRIIEDDPTIVIIEFALNDALAAKSITPEASLSNTLSIMNQIRLARPGVKIMLMTTSNVRRIGTGVAGEHRYYDVYRFLANRDDGPRVDWFFDGASFWWQVADLYFPDGIHPTVGAWSEYIIPRMERYLGPLLRQAVAHNELRFPRTALPSAPWQPVP